MIDGDVMGGILIEKDGRLLEINGGVGLEMHNDLEIPFGEIAEKQVALLSASEQTGIIGDDLEPPVVGE